MKILIVGGGIGGLTTALCLARAGHEVSVFEQSERFSEVGAGLQCGANAVRVFQYLELQQQLQAMAVEPKSIDFREHRSGRILYQVPLGEHYAKRYGAPYFHLHRADLISVLVAAAEQQANIKLHLGEAIQGFSEDKQSVLLSLENGAQHEADLLVGSDGVHSVIRRAIVGDAPARFTGNVAWRATLPVERLPASFMPAVVTNFVGPKRHMVLYYLRRQRLLNLVGVVENSRWKDDSWVAKAPWSEFRRDFAGWHPMVEAAIEAVDKEACFRWALYDHAPLNNWSTKRATLLGDAAHATLPFMASGAAMAIEDARILQRALAAEHPIEQALQLYQQARMPRTARIQTTSRKFGRLYHIQNRLLLRAAFAGLRFLGGKKEDFLPEYDANTVPLKE